MNKIVVTGGAGMIGRAIVASLSERYEVFVIDPLAPGFGEADRNVHYCKEDIRDYERIKPYLYDAFCLVHLAAAVHWRPRTLQDELVFRDINTTATEQLFRLASDLGVKRALFFSTTDVYANSFVPITEDALVAPSSVYGKTKYAAEQVVSLIAQNSRMGIGIFRPASVFGEGDHGSMKALIDLAKKGYVPMLGNGSNVKALTYLQDLVAAVSLFVEQKSIDSGLVYNIASGNYSFTAIVKAMQDAFGYSIRTIRVPRWASLLPFVPHSVREKLAIAGSSKPISTEKAQSLLGFSPTQSLKMTLGDCAAYYTN